MILKSLLFYWKTKANWIDFMDRQVKNYTMQLRDLTTWGRH